MTRNGEGFPYGAARKGRDTLGSERMKKVRMRPSIWKALVMRGMKIINILIGAGLFILCWREFYRETYAPISWEAGTAIVLFYVVLLILLKRIYNAYDVGGSRVSELIYSLCLADVIANGTLYVVFAMSMFQIPYIIPFFLLIFVQAMWNGVWSFMANRLYFQIHKPKATAIIYKEDNDLQKLEEIKYFTSKFNVQKYIKNPKDDIHKLIEEIRDYDVVFVSGVAATLRNGIAKYCVEEGVQGYIAPHVGDIIMAGAHHMQMFSVPIMRIRRAHLTPEYMFVKRAFDIIASLIAVIVTSPFMLLTAIAIKVYDHGPVIYRQVRLTKDGKKFEIMKFRSMKVNAEKDGVARLASEHDDRITPVGHFIRACRLDELPQLFNILKGDMTIVGPRPERPEIAAQYQEEMPSFVLRLQVKAGLTGFAQIYGRYNSTPYDKLQMDLMYINKMSVAEDLRLMFATVKVLFMKESTSGVQDGQVTASAGSAESQMESVDVEMAGMNKASKESA